MPYVNVPNDLSKVKTKMALNLTKRQLICFGCAAAVGIPSYLLARGSIGNTGAMFLTTRTTQLFRIPSRLPGRCGASTMKTFQQAKMTRNRERESTMP